VLTDLLVFSRDLRLNLYEHRLADLLAESVEDCRQLAAERGVTVRIECAPDTCARLDKLKIRQTVGNLLRNAIEASPTLVLRLPCRGPPRSPERRGLR
jgi:signal transduction histidine kinase